MNRLFEPGTIGSMTLKNRMVRSATWEGMCDPEGRPTKKLTQYYDNLAKGGIGLIISGYTYVSLEGKQSPGKMGLYSDDFKSEFKEMTRVVHDAGCKIAMQLVHAGGQAKAKFAGSTPVAPSGIEAAQYSEKPLQLTESQIDDIVQAFGKAALRAKQYGFDGVQIHGAHGYLINQFLSPLTNNRQDQYGGSIENRCRFLMEVYDEIRQMVGKDFTVFIKLNAADYLEQGLELEDALFAAKMLSQKGIDAIEVSAGTGASKKKSPIRIKIDQPEKEAYNLEVSLAVKNVVSCPVISVGGFRSYKVSRQTLEKHGLDFISFSRPLIREPGLPLRWQQGDLEPAACISCNACFKPAYFKGGIYCVAKEKEK
jgi:2,4-dienoyl-CoA reductase-like NADH-dependent reductase (Old Yellow Enzyme family)